MWSRETGFFWVPWPQYGPFSSAQGGHHYSCWYSNCLDGCLMQEGKREAVQVASVDIRMTAVPGP